MDERLEKALDFSKYMVTINNQKRILQEKFKESLIYFTEGSQFTITRELITFIDLLVKQGADTDVVLTDGNDRPVMIPDLAKFSEDILDIYFEASNDYHNSYVALGKKRSVEKLIEND